MEPPSPFGGESPVDRHWEPSDRWQSWQRAADGEWWEAQPHLSPLRLAPFPTRSLFELTLGNPLLPYNDRDNHDARDTARFIRQPLDFIERDIYHRHIDPLTDTDAQRAARLGPQESASNYASALAEEVSRRNTLWTTFVNAVATHNIRQIELWRDRALAEPIPAYEPREDLLRRAGWSQAYTERHVAENSVRAPRADPPGDYRDQDDIQRYHEFLDYLEVFQGNRRPAVSRTPSPVGSEGGRTRSYHSGISADDVGDDFADTDGRPSPTAVEAHDARTDRANGKDPASDDDDDAPMSPVFDGGCSAAGSRRA